MERTLVFGDIHGCVEEFDELFKKIKYRPDADQIVFLGDFVDKGKNPKGAVERAMDLVRQYGAEAIGGNHEQIFLNWLEGNDYKPQPYLAEKVGGRKTVESFYPKFVEEENEEQAREYILNECAEHVEFIKSLPDYRETETHIYVHAGVDPEKEDWRNTSAKDFRWIRRPFHEGKIHTTKTIVFGHTPTKFLHQEETNHGIWVKDNKIGIDGGCVYGGLLHCLILTPNGNDVYSVEKIKRAEQ